MRISAVMTTVRTARCILVVLSVSALGGCSTLASKAVGGTVESLGVSFAQDEDPEFVAGALPLGLKLVEARLLRNPRDAGMLLSACKGFTQYSQAFVAEPATYVEAKDLSRARSERARAGRMFLRARGYCLRALDVRRDGLGKSLAASDLGSLSRARREDAELLYWTAASWGAAISVSRSNFELVADLRLAHRIALRASELDPGLGEGAVYELLLPLEAALSPASGGSIERARDYFRRARELSRGKRIGPLVALAESVSVKEQNGAEFRKLLTEALAFDLESAPDARLVNTISRRRAEWLLGRADDLFVEVAP